MPASRTLPTVAALALAGLLWSPLHAQAPVLELDHVYIVVQPPIPLLADALRHLGLVVDTAVNRHEGQGTASIAAFFENAYLELLWVDSTVAVDSAHQADIIDFRRASTWRQSGASPFGFGLHVLTGNPEDLALPVRRLPASHLGPNIFYLLLRQPGESLAADIFVMPTRAAVTQWLGRYQTRRPDLFAHPLGARRITRVVLHGTAPNRPQAMDLSPQPMSFESAPAQYVSLELDGVPQGREWDLRPVLPLVVRR